MIHICSKNIILKRLNLSRRKINIIWIEWFEERWLAITYHSDFFGARSHELSVLNSRNKKQPFTLTASAGR